MTEDEILLLDSPELRASVESNIGRKPEDVALDKRLPHARLVATQVKYLGRARHKLPSYYSARAILPPLAFEQSSSEAAAGRHDWHGEVCIDLTCGLGVDSFMMSRRFGRVITVERDKALATAARLNFARLGVTNVEVVESSAEEFLRDYAASGRKADMVYADPDRRSAQGRKLVRMEDCSPDMSKLLPLAERVAERVAVKLSPLFDVDEAFRLFAGGCVVEVYSLAGECKEVVVETGRAVQRRTLCATAEGLGSVSYGYPLERSGTDAVFAPPYSYMVIPDVALRKARMVAAYRDSVMPWAQLSSDNGYLFADRLPEGVIGRVFEVEKMERFDAGRLKRRLRNAAISAADLYIGDSPLGAPELARRLGIREGGVAKLAFTEICKELWVVVLKGVSL